MQETQLLMATATDFKSALNAINQTLQSDEIKALPCRVQSIMVFQEVTPNPLDPKSIKIQVHMVAILVTDDMPMINEGIAAILEKLNWFQALVILKNPTDAGHIG